MKVTKTCASAAVAILLVLAVSMDLSAAEPAPNLPVLEAAKYVKSPADTSKAEIQVFFREFVEKSGDQAALEELAGRMEAGIKNPTNWVLRSADGKPIEIASILAGIENQPAAPRFVVRLLITPLDLGGLTASFNGKTVEVLSKLTAKDASLLDNRFEGGWAVQVSFNELDKIRSDEYLVTGTQFAWDDDLRARANWSVSTTTGAPVAIKEIAASQEWVTLWIDWDRKSQLVVKYHDQSRDVVVPASLANLPTEIVLPPQVEFKARPSGPSYGGTYDATLLNIPLFRFPLGQDGTAGTGELNTKLATKGTVEFPSTSITNATTLGLGADLMYLVDKYFYGVKLSADCGFSFTGNLTNPMFSGDFYVQADLFLEIPLTNYPFIALHDLTGYKRQAIPLSAELFVARANPNATSATSQALPPPSDMLELRLKYEMAFAPLINLKPQYVLKYDLGTARLSSMLKLKWGASLSTLLPILGSLGIAPSPDQNFVFVGVDWDFETSSFNNFPISFGFSSFF